MTKYSHLSNPSLKHSTMVLSSATSSRPIPNSIIPGLKGNVNHMIVTLTIFLDLDLFHSLDYDTELIVYQLDGMGTVSRRLQPRYGIEFMGYQIPW